MEKPGRVVYVHHWKIQVLPGRLGRTPAKTTSRLVDYPAVYLGCFPDPLRQVYEDQCEGSEVGTSKLPTWSSRRRNES